MAYGSQNITAPPRLRPKANADGAAIAALICAFFIPPLGVIFGHVSRGQAKRAGQQPSAVATWGAVLGYVFTALTVIVIIAVIVAAVKFGSNPPTSPPGINGLTPAPATT
jgi:peptidyl-prolyl cis-trans isomerase B (cyclophilin B)